MRALEAIDWILIFTMQATYIKKTKTNIEIFQKIQYGRDNYR